MDKTFGFDTDVEEAQRAINSAYIEDLLEKSNARDASGNVILRNIGVHIQQQIRKHFKEIDVHADIKYTDPTYMICACRANASDAILCTVLGQNAVHGAFAGYIGNMQQPLRYLPIPEVISSTRRVDTPIVECGIGA
ncbi:hypothetical protein MKX01_007370 [Papaver californicum]|nr:hypothetical protein MKX01_007370 [Papaver californicum]